LAAVLNAPVACEGAAKVGKTLSCHFTALPSQLKDW
jgi:hypothetical protein